MFDLGIESIKRYNEAAYYGPIWVVTFRDYTTVVVLHNEQDARDCVDDLEGNFVMEEEPL